MTEERFKKKLEKIKLKSVKTEYKKQLKAEKKRMKDKNTSKPKMKTSNKILIAAILAITLFTFACLFVQYRTGYEVSSTLATLWFSFWTIEVGCLAGIKISKVRKENNEYIE